MRLMRAGLDNDLNRQSHLIQKRPLPVALHTTNQFILGTFHVREIMRVFEELTFEKTLIAVTDAEIFN